MPLLSVIIPAYNEERTLGRLLERIQQVPIEKMHFKMEIIVVDDGSSDDTFKIASSFQRVTCVRQDNQGKGAAVQHGIRICKGDYFIVQDADLEYDPKDYLPMLERIPVRPTGLVVYGSRTLGQMRQPGFRLLPGKHPNQGIGPWGMNLVLSFWILLLYRQWISDPLTGYKLYPTQMVRKLHVRSRGFEADHEITAKLIKRDISIVEVPIRYTPRSDAEGKKIRPRDGWIALKTLWENR